MMQAESTMKKLVLSILAILLLVEEWLWDALTALSHRLFIWLGLAGFERWLANATPAVAMAAFVLPIALIAPVKFFAILLFAQGQIIQGLGLIVAAKLFATLLISRMFAITRQQLLTFKWFAALYSTITRWLDWAHKIIRETPVYRQAVKLKQAIRARLADWLRRPD